MSAKYTFLAWDTPVNNASTKLALLQLANNADDNGFSYYSISKMATACDMSERSFMRKIQDLESMGVLVVERRANRPSLYTLVGDEMGVTICHLQNPEVTGCHAGVTDCHGVSDRLSHDPNSDPKTFPESIMRVEKSPSKAKGLTEFPDGFEITESMVEWFTEQDFKYIDLGRATDKWVDAMKAKGSRYKDWTAAWRNGMNNAEKWSAPK